MSRRSKRAKRQAKQDRRAKNRWKRLLRHAQECSGDRTALKNWGFTTDSQETKWHTHVCLECGLYYKTFSGEENKRKMRVRGCGTFTVPLDVISLLGAIGASA